jgi:hypothetical protein
MDHTLGPLQQIHSKLKTPLLTLTNYDHKHDGFIGYPERQGWKPRPADEWRGLFKSRDPDFLAFLQRWLYFGLLECVVGTKVDVTSFTEDGQYLSSRKLPQVAEETMSLDLDGETVRATIRHGIHMHLHLFKHRELPETPDTRLMTNFSLQTFIEKVPMEDPRDPANVIATSLLIDFLYNFLLHRWEGYLQASVNDPKILEPGTGPLSHMLKKDGWCPSEVAAIRERFSVSGVYFMTQVRPPNPKDHLTGETCSHFKCKYREMNSATYQTSHVPGCTGVCGDVGVDPEELARILVDEKNIPLIDASSEWNDPHKTPGISLVSWNASEAFVALSHVWADGLGNLEANALPRCQLLRLSRMVQELSNQSKAFFWLDTICVPPDSALNSMDPFTSRRQRDAQNQAITKMRQTYEESEYVLVIDSWIVSDTSSNMGDAEKLMRIFCSGWNTRLWTYQEGALAKKLFFQLRDELYDLDAAIVRIRQSQDWSMNYTLQGPLMVQYDSLRGFRNQKPDNVERIKFLATALSFRTTSVASDEALCLSTLMGFNIQDILDVKDLDDTDPMALANSRMKAFWAQFDEVPRVLIKFDGPTLSEDAWSWAPSSLLLSKDRPLHAYRCFMTSSPQPAIRTTDGLSVDLPGLLFRSSVPLGVEFYVRDESQTLYHIYFELTRYKNLARTYIHNHSGHYQEELCIDSYSVTGSDQLAFIFDQTNDEEGDTRPKSSHTTETGILVAVNSILGDGSLKAKKLGYAVRKTLSTSQHKDEYHLRSYIQKSAENEQDYEANRLKYPGKKNGTLLCTKGCRVPRQAWNLS